MIARRLLDELQQLDRKQKLEVIRVLKKELNDETSARNNLSLDPGRVFRIPSVRVNFNEARSFLESQDEKIVEND